MGKKASMNRFMGIMFIFLAIALGITFLWNHIPFVKEAVDSLLRPTAGSLIMWNTTIGSIIVFFLIAIFTTLFQKYFTDQKTLRELRKEQKEIQKKMKEFKQNPEKVMELQREAFPTTIKMMEVSMKSSLFTIIPFILLLRWFMGFYNEIGNPEFLGFMSWFWFYLLSIIVFSMILRKVFKVA